jgi:hypothetical protein
MYLTQDIVCFASLIELMMPYTDDRLNKEEPDDYCSKDNMSMRVIINLVIKMSVTFPFLLTLLWDQCQQQMETRERKVRAKHLTC